MLQVKEIMELAKITFLNNIAIQNNDEALIRLVHLGVSELYRRFNLSIKSETVITSSNLSLYEIKNPNVSLLLGVYDTNGRELVQTDVSNSLLFEYKLVNYRSFLLRTPFDGRLYAIFKASPNKFTSPEDIIDLPDAMTDALLTYVAYLGHSSINRDNINEASAYLQRFNVSCKELEMQGYKIALDTETINLITKGFV